MLSLGESAGLMRPVHNGYRPPALLEVAVEQATAVRMTDRWAPDLSHSPMTITGVADLNVTMTWAR